MAFDLTKAIGLKNVSNLDTGEMQEIKVSLLDPTPNNFFLVEDDVTDLCESIKVNGLLQPPVVTPSENGRYRIIAGHRRHKALQALSAELPDKFGTVLCRVVRPSSPALEELMLIQTNTEAREIGYRERNEAATRVEKILVSLKEQGVELPGKMRSHVARIIKASESQIARAKYIAEHLIKPFRSAKNLSDSVAYRLAHLPEEQQFALHDHYKSHLYMIDGTRINSYLKNIKEGKEPFAAPPPSIRDCYAVGGKGGHYPPCSHVDVINRRSNDKGLPEYQRCANRTCCQFCAYCFDCEDVCPVLAKNIAKAKSNDNYRIGQALRRARCKAGLSLSQAAHKLSVSIDQLICYETTQTHTTGSLLKLCGLYEVTPNEVLGVCEAPSPTPAQWTAPEDMATIPDGMYSMAFYYTKSKCDGAGGKIFIHTRLAQRKGGRWLSEVNSLPIELYKITIISITPYPKAPEGYTYSLGGDASGG